MVLPRISASLAPLCVLSTGQQTASLRSSDATTLSSPTEGSAVNFVRGNGFPALNSVAAMGPNPDEIGIGNGPSAHTRHAARLVNPATTLPQPRVYLGWASSGPHAATHLQACPLPAAKPLLATERECALVAAPAGHNEVLHDPALWTSGRIAGSVGGSQYPEVRVGTLEVDRKRRPRAG